MGLKPDTQGHQDLIEYFSVAGLQLQNDIEALIQIQGQPSEQQPN